jgi:hypothetical protein
MVTNRQPAIYPGDPGRLHRLLYAATGHLADITYEVIYRLEDGNSTKWLFSSSLTVCLECLITPERNTATGLVIAPPVCELTDV